MSHPHFKSAPLALAVVLAFAVMPPAMAQSAPPVTIALAAQPLGQALNELARQTNLQLMFSPSLVAGKSAPEVSGRMTAQQALERLLAGSGLVAAVDGSSVVIKAAPASSAPTATLAEVAVVAQADNTTTTEGTGSYTTRATGAGTRMALSPRETPQSVSVVGRQQIEDQNLMTLVDVLRQTPGIVADRLDERVSFSSRGFALSTMIDGVPTLSFNSVAGEASMTTTAIYDRIEVVRGAAGLLNGNGSPGGAVNLVRKRPGKAFAGKVGAGIGSWNRYQLEADVGGALNDSGSVRGRLVATHADADSFIDHKQTREDVAYGIVEADLGPRTMLAAGFEYQKTATDGANFGQSPLFYSDGSRTDLPRSFNSSTSWSVWDMTTKRVFANLEHQFDNGWKVKADAAYTELERKRFSADTWLYPANINPLTGMGRVQVAGNPADGSNKSFDVYASGPFALFGRNHQAVLGANINRSNYSFSNSGPLATGFYQPAVSIFDLESVPQPDFTYPLNATATEVTEKAAYGALRLKASDTLAVLLGGRMSWYRSDTARRFWTNGTNGAPVSATPVKESAVFTPYAGLVYDVSADYSVYASYTDIFQPNTTRDANNEILDPRRGTNVELGLKGEHWGGKLNSSLAVFRTEEDNVSTLDTGAAPLPDGSTPSRAVKGARSKGFEATLAGELLPGLQLMGGYTYHAKRDANGLLLNPTYPQRMFRVAGTYRLPGALNQLTVGGNINYQSAIYYDESTSRLRATQGGVTLFGLMARYTVSPKVSALLNIENLGDKYYYAGLGGYNGYTYGSPRKASLKVEYSF